MESLVIGGTETTTLNSETGVTLISSGDDPQIMINVPSSQVPVKLTISLRTTPTPLPAPEIISGLIKGIQSATEQGIAAARVERDRCQEQQRQAARERDQAVSEGNSFKERMLSAEGKLREETSVRAAMQQSVSWRVTEPFRKLMALLRPASRTAR